MLMSRLIFCLTVLCLSACSHLPLPSGMDENRLVLDTLAQAQRVAQASAEEQRRELTSAQQAFNRDKGTANRLRLGVLLSLPQSGGDEGRALGVLEPLASSGNGPAGQFAALISAQLTERQRVDRRGQQWKEQLDQLKNIERQLIERGKGGR